MVPKVLSAPHPVKVLFLVDKSGFGGVQTIAATMLERGVAGTELCCFFLRNVNRDYGIEDSERRDVIYARSRRKYGLGSFFELYRLVVARGIEIVHLNGTKATLYGYLLKRLRPQLRIVNHDHSGEFDYRGWFARFLRFAAPRVDLFLCVSERRRRFLMERCAVPAGRIEVLNNFVDERRFRPQPPVDPGGESGFVLGFVGRLSHVKGCDLLLRALPMLVGEIPGLALRIVGAGVEQPALQSLAVELGIADRVTFCGYLENPAEAYAGFDALVIPSRAEEGPICLYEAWMMGVPVVASDAPVIDTRIADRRTGLLFPTEDVAGLAARVRELWASERLRQELVANGMEAAAPLTARHYLERLSQLYADLVKRERV